MTLKHSPLQIDRDINFMSFTLPDGQGVSHNSEAIRGEAGILVMFICNHCPYVQGILDRLSDTARELQKMNIGVVAINSNDASTYHDDAPEHMLSLAKAHHFTFPYLVDESQEIAKEYDAVCTPDFFLFNASGKLQYRGRLDSSGANPASEDTVPELLNAAKEIVLCGEFTDDCKPAMGCSIKWKEG
jgi:peroxiredoxin